MAIDCFSLKRIIFSTLMKTIAVILFIFCTGSALFSQLSGIRPKIGLALSGGGSKGIAHVGVLKVMEEAGLRPDYITGVSMGSIIGGMYAIGYSADSIHKILNAMNWDLNFTNVIPENKIVFTEKEHYRNSIVSLPVSAKKVRLPSGLINGQQIENQLSYYCWPAAGINDFSELPIPFMCLATDILTGKIVELKTGYLPDAMRASSAVPTFFTPVRIDTALLIDGGVLRNYAGVEAKQMGADIVIGSYTGFQTYSEEQLQSLPGIVKQIIFFKASEDFKIQKKVTDLLIEPKVKGLSSMVFSNIDSIVERGYKAALPYKDYFRRLADSINRFGPAKVPENILNRQLISFDKIEITGNKIYSDSQILGVLGIRPGEKIDKNTITEKIDLLFGKTWFEKVKYRILNRNDSLILNIDCIEESNSMLYGGGYYDKYLRSGIVLRMTFKDLLTTKSLIDFDAFIGQYYRTRVSLLQFLDRNQKFAISAVIYYDNTLLPMLHVMDEAGSFLNRTFNTRLFINKYLGLNNMMNISLNFENSNFVPDFVSIKSLKRVTYNTLSASYNYQLNTIDTKNFPHRGTLFHFSAITSKLISGVLRNDYVIRAFKEGDAGDFSFKRLYSFTGGFRNYIPAGRKLTLTLKGDFLYSFDIDTITSLQNQYYLGGFSAITDRSVPVTGFNSNEIAVNKFASAGADLYIDISKDTHLFLMTNIVAANEVPEKEKISILGGYGVGFGYMSIIGPMRIGIMHGLSSNPRYFNALKGFISIGYSF